MSQNIIDIENPQSRLPRLIDLYIGKKLSELRERENITMAHLEEKAGLDIGTISRFENGTVRITPSELLELSIVFNVGLSYFYA